MAQQVKKALGTKPEDLNSISMTHMVGENQLSLVVSPVTYGCIYAHPHTHATHKINTYM